MTSRPDPAAGIESDIRAELDRVETLLVETVRSDLSLVTEAATFLIDAGGKRLRPMLTLLAARIGDAGDDRVIPCAAAIELTHLASLYHDDVIDETSVRRGVATANARYGNSVAVLTGDFLFARSSSLAAGLGSYVSRTLADTIAALCEGQIAEGESAGRFDATEEAYLGVIRRKTASLIATSCHLGAWLAGAGDEGVAAATAYGEALGMAFQLADDVLDIAGDESESGKTPGTDLKEGVFTLPVLTTFAGTCPGGADLRAALEVGEIAAALDLLRTNGSVEVARGAVAQWQERARDALAPLAAGEARGAMEDLVSFVGERTG